MVYVDDLVEEWQGFVKASNGRGDLWTQPLLATNKRMLTEERAKEETLLNQYQILAVTRSTVS